MLGTRGVVYERGLAPLLRDALAELGGEAGVDVLVELDDGSDDAGDPRRGRLRDDRRGRRADVEDEHVARRPLHRVHRRHDRSPQGGAVAPGRHLRRRASGGSRRRRRGDDPRPRRGRRRRVVPDVAADARRRAVDGVLAASMGATVVLHDDRSRFDAPTILATAARERANMMTIIGDAYARPLGRGAATHALRPLGARRARHRRRAHERGREGRARGAPAERHDPRRLRRVGDRGDGLGRPERATSPQTQRFQVDPLGAHPRRRPHPLPRPPTRRGRLDRAHRARAARLPRRRGRNQRDVPGRRGRAGGGRRRPRAVHRRRPGRAARARLARGEHRRREGVRRRGRGRAEAPRRRRRRAGHRRPDERFGQEVVAVVQLTGPDAASPAVLRAWCGEHLARYKAPRAFLFVDEVRRHPSGKADYRWAKEQAATAVDAVG